MTTNDYNSFYDNNNDNNSNNNNNNIGSKSLGIKTGCFLIQNEEYNKLDKKFEIVNNRKEKMNGSIIKGILSNFKGTGNEVLNSGKDIFIDNKNKNVNQLNNIEIKNISTTLTPNIYEKDNECSDFIYNSGEGIYDNEIFSTNCLFEAQRYFDLPCIYKQNEIENMITHDNDIHNSNSKYDLYMDYKQYNYKNKTNKQENNSSFRDNVNKNDEIFYGYMNQEYNMLLENDNDVENIMINTNCLNNLSNAYQNNIHNGSDFWEQSHLFNYGNTNDGNINETNNTKDIHFDNNFFFENNDFPLDNEEYPINFCGDMVFNFAKNAE
ncbi:hypothetical protein PBNK65NY_000068800 [Plasmodium berghei]|nr:hypothetical protein PBNK65NY_000068800 [Plasmodium berghei]